MIRLGDLWMCLDQTPELSNDYGWCDHYRQGKAELFHASFPNAE